MPRHCHEQAMGKRDSADVDAGVYVRGLLVNVAGSFFGQPQDCNLTFTVRNQADGMRRLRLDSRNAAIWGTEQTLDKEVRSRGEGGSLSGRWRPRPRIAGIGIYLDR